jgi:formylglycine-generating enzyme required for sulfatase activity
MNTFISQLMRTMLALAAIWAGTHEARGETLIFTGFASDRTVTWTCPDKNVAEYSIVSTTNIFQPVADWPELITNIAPAGSTTSVQLPLSTESRFYGVRAYLVFLPTNAPPEGMRPIPPGYFFMGNSSLDTEGDETEVPVHTVSLKAFYIDAHEITWAQWTEVSSWATERGYTFDGFADGKGPNHPVQSVSWYDCVKWCNARSEKEGLTPCYYTSASFTDAFLYTNGVVNLSNEWVNWDADGYRLPTEAEWENAARGGLLTNRFPWGDTISHNEANYYSNTNLYPYDVSLTLGCHPSHATLPMPYTCPVGSFPTNSYGLSEMSGNVWEWCWDWKGFYPESPQIDPRGPASGRARIIRGGNWAEEANLCRVACRGDLDPGSNEGNTTVGFRTAVSARR